jgi:hypothetical protein
LITFNNHAEIIQFLAIITVLILSTCFLTVPYGTRLPTVNRALEALMRWVATRVVLWSTLSVDVVLIVHAFGIFLSMATSAYLIRFIESLCFDEFVDLSTDKPYQGLLGESMADGLA